MTQREAAIQQLKALKEKTLKHKIEHIFTYYRIPIIAILLTAVFAVSYVNHLISAKDTVLHIACLDTTVLKENEETFISALSQAAGIDCKKETIVISTDPALQGEVYDGEVLAAQIIGGMIDILAFDEETGMQWLYQDVFADLSEVLTIEQQEKYKNNFLYVDAAVLEKADNPNETSGTISFPDPAKPEEMEKPVPVALRVTNNAEFADVFFPDSKSTVVVGIVVNAPNMSHALYFLEYLMK